MAIVGDRSRAWSRETASQRGLVVYGLLHAYSRDNIIIDRSEDPEDLKTTKTVASQWCAEHEEGDQAI